MTKDKIIFFASGDFAIDTFESFLLNDYNVVGLVTSNDKVKFHNRRIRDVAEVYGVPVYVIKNDVKMEEDGFFIDWLKRANADIFCVISFKKLPSEVIRLANKCAFNVHASLLPFLRGSAPINWAIRLGYKETGLTAFVLNDKIDCGDIIANTKVKISDDDKFTTLFMKLSSECVDFTFHVIDDVLQRDDWEKFLIKQPSWNKNYEYVAEAHKLNDEYFNYDWTWRTAQETLKYVNSVDDEGVPCTIITLNEQGKKVEFIGKIYEVEVVNNNEPQPNKVCESDGKTYIKINFVDNSQSLLVKRIQLAGKKIMNVEDFLNGFRYFRDYENTILTFKV